jgi:hypothetical protein
MKTVSKKIIDKHSMTASKISEIGPVLDSSGYAVHIVVTGSTPSGTVYIEASIDQVEWIPIESGTIVLSGTAESHFRNYTKVEYPYMRVRYVTTTGASGVMDCHFSKKVD